MASPPKPPSRGGTSRDLVRHPIRSPSTVRDPQADRPVYSKTKSKNKTNIVRKTPIPDETKPRGEGRPTVASLIPEDERPPLPEERQSIIPPDTGGSPIGTHYGRQPEQAPLKNFDPNTPANVKALEDKINALFLRVMQNPEQAVRDGLIAPVDTGRMKMRPVTSTDQLHINQQDRLYMDACIDRVLGGNHDYLIQINEVIGDLVVKIQGKRFR